MSAGIYVVASMTIVGGVLGTLVGVYLMDCIAKPFERRRQINLAATREATHSVRMKTLNQLFPEKKYQVEEKEDDPTKEAVAQPDEEKGIVDSVATQNKKIKKDVTAEAPDQESNFSEEEQKETGNDKNKKEVVVDSDEGDTKDINASPPTVDEEEDLGEVCAICLERFQQDEMVMEGLECHHEYHRTCMMEWLHKHNDCPVCRERMWTREAFVMAKKKVLRDNPALLKTEMAAAQAVEETMETAAAEVGGDDNYGNDVADDSVNDEEHDEENPNTTTTTSPSPSTIL